MNKGLNNKTVTTCTNKAQNNIVCMKTNCTYCYSYRNCTNSLF